MSVVEGATVKDNSKKDNNKKRKKKKTAKDELWVGGSNACFRVPGCIQLDECQIKCDAVMAL